MRNSIAYFTGLVFLLQTLLIPLPVYAQSSDEENVESPPAEQVTALTLGQPAPFTGTLFSTAATARMLAELELSRESCDLRLNQAVEENTARYQLQIDQLNINLRTNEEIFNARLEIRDDQISFLQERYQPPKWYEHPAFWITVGVVVGAGTTIGITYAVNQPN